MVPEGAAIRLRGPGGGGVAGLRRGPDGFSGGLLIGGNEKE